MTTSPYRIRARKIIAPVLQAHAGCTAKEMRKHIRAAFQAALWEEHVYGQRIRREETNIALGEQMRTKRRSFLPTEEVMPAMRDWAASHGLIRAKPTTDVWQDTAVASQ